MVSKLSDVNINEDTALGRAEMYLSRNSELLYYSPAKKSQFTRNLYVRIYSRPLAIGVKFNEELFKKGLETVRSFLILFKHNEIFLKTKIFQNLNIHTSFNLS